MSHSMDIRVRWLNRSGCMVDFSLLLMRASFEKDRSPLALVTGKVRYRRSAMSMLGNTVCRPLFLISFRSSPTDVDMVMSLWTYCWNWIASSTKSSSWSIAYYSCSLDAETLRPCEDVVRNVFKKPKLSTVLLYAWYLLSSSTTSLSITTL